MAINESYMNQKMREHFQSVLTKLKKDIMSSSNSTIGHMKNEHERYADNIDLASQEEVFRLELRERDRERHLLKNIERALDDITQGDYGYCEPCGAEIGICPP